MNQYGEKSEFKLNIFYTRTMSIYFPSVRMTMKVT